MKTDIYGRLEHFFIGAFDGSLHNGVSDSQPNGVHIGLTLIPSDTEEEWDRHLNFTSPASV